MDAQHPAQPADPPATPEDDHEEEWPPRAWRETTRKAGHRQALTVSLGMLVVFGVLVVIAIWASHNG